MVGSLHDAEDAMQEAMLRAWRGIGRFEGRSSLRSWLYTIATNASLRLIERRPKRVLPIEFGPPADPHGDVAAPLVESAWIEPFPDERLGVEDATSSPEARYEQRESVELAFAAALQHLPGLQRAALILTDVLGFSPGEVAERSIRARLRSIAPCSARARRQRSACRTGASSRRWARSETTVSRRSSTGSWRHGRRRMSSECGRC